MRDTTAPPSPPSATQYEQMRDAGYRHLEHADEDDQRATQRLQARPQRVGDNIAALNAVIESITCTNFMCHTRLHCDLGPLLNFIVGENGSGKSAILTAITLCLGGKASSTNRGASLRSFIKEGQDHASLRVKIKNQGPDAYQPATYGDSIIVERNFNKSGASGFKLKTANEYTVSTKKGDVDDVVEYYCLQVDNPLNVLSQDNARQFLNAASASVKYKYFLQGTQLEQLDHDLKLFAELMDNQEAKQEEYQETVAELKERYEKAKKIKETSDKNEEMRRKNRVYMNQLAWAQVEEQEIILEEKTNAIRHAEEEVQRLQQVVEEKTAQLAVSDDKIRHAQEVLNQVNQTEGDWTDKLSEAEAALKTAKEAVSQLHSQERELHEQIKHAAHIVKTKEQSIAAEDERLKAVNDGAATKAQAALDEAKQAHQALVEKIDEHANQLPQLQEEYATAEKEAQELAAVVETKHREVGAAEGRIRSLDQSRGDSMAGYHPKMPQLLRNIKADRGFREEPIGPLGVHVQLTQPRWSSILETMLNTLLNSFIVSNLDDQKRMNQHFERLSMSHGHSVFISHPGFVIRELQEPEPKFETVLRVLKFDNQRVRDQFILSNNIEQLLLAPSRVQGQDIMFDDQPPLNATACITPHDKRGQGLRLSRKKNNFETSTIRIDPKIRPRMKSDTDTQIRMQKEVLEQLQAEYRDLENTKRSAQQAALRCSQAVTKHKKQAADLERQRRTARVEVDRAQDAFDHFEGDDTRLQGIREALQEAQEKHEHYGQQYAGMHIEKEEKNKVLENLRQEFKRAKQDVSEFRTRRDKAQNKVDRLEELRKTSLAELNQAHESIDMAKMGKVDAEKARMEQEHTVQEFIAGASEAAPQRVVIPEGETYASIERKFHAVREQLRRFREHIGASEEEINNRLILASEKYHEAERTQKNLSSLLFELKKALSNRLDKWRAFQRLISAQSRANFQYLLSERGFRGKLLLDHVNKALEIRVEPDSTKRDNSGRNTKTLSGGEKSFSSICLLLAIWDAMGSPLRCLDEFDVFMDNVNRAISTNMLVR